MKNKELAELLGITQKFKLPHIYLTFSSICEVEKWVRANKNGYVKRLQHRAEAYTFGEILNTVQEVWIDFQNPVNFVKLLQIVAQYPYTFLLCGNQISIKNSSHINIGFYESDTLEKSLIGLLLEQLKNLSSKNKIKEQAQKTEWGY